VFSRLDIDTSKSTLVIHGERDEVVPYSHSVEFVAEHPFAKLISLEDNHQMMAYPQRLLEQVIGFLKLI
jgi:pimeloyl-ACP methyl ester carboxylesterase